MKGEDTENFPNVLALFTIKSVNFKPDFSGDRVISKEFLFPFLLRKFFKRETYTFKLVILPIITMDCNDTHKDAHWQQDLVLFNN